MWEGLIIYIKLMSIGGPPRYQSLNKYEKDSGHLSLLINELTSIRIVIIYYLYNNVAVSFEYIYEYIILTSN